MFYNDHPRQQQLWQWDEDGNPHISYWSSGMKVDFPTTHYSSDYAFYLESSLTCESKKAKRFFSTVHDALKMKMESLW